MCKKLLIPTLLIAGLSFASAAPKYKIPSVKGDVDNSDYYFNKDGSKKKVNVEKDRMEQTLKITQKKEKTKTVKSGKKNQL